MSKYFKAALGPNFKEGSKTEFVLEGTDAGTVKAIVDFCYTGCITLTEGNVGKFLAISSSVELDLLEAKCRRFYGEKLSVTNCVDVLMVADKYSYADLLQRALDLICGGFNQIPTSDIQKLDQRLFQEILRSDKIQASEEYVFRRLLEWLQCKEDERKPYMPEMLKLVRLEHMTPQFLGGEMLPVVYEKFQSSKLVISEFKRRSSNQYSSMNVKRFRRSRSIYSLFLQDKGDNGADCSAIKIEKYNNVLNTFEETAEITLEERQCFNAVLLENKLFVFGGRTADNIFLKCMSSYDLSSREESVLPEMKKPRDDAVPIVVGKYIYVFGGYNAEGTIEIGYLGQTIKSCERFDTEKNEWKVLKPMKRARYNASVAVLNGYIYVAGGQDNDGREIDLVELYDPNCDEWTSIKPMNEARSKFALIEVNGFLYAMGGGVDIIEKYDPYKVCWTEIGTIKLSRYISSGIFVDGQIFVIMRDGGYGEVKIDGSDKCSFVPLTKSNYACDFKSHILFHNRLA